MSTNLATILVGLGYDLSALVKGAPEAFQLINKQTLGMSAEMKRASREGAESWRLIDESLGIHLSRPLTRLITQEFPAFASAMQSVLGAGVLGALGVAGIEFFDKIAKKIEEARAAQEHYAEASKTLDETVGNVLGGIQKKILQVTSKDAVLHIRLQGAEEAKQGIDQIAKALDALQAAADKSSGFWTQLEAGAGDFFAQVAEGWTELVDLHNKLLGLKGPSFHDAIYGSDGLNSMKAALSDMRETFNEALKVDSLKGTHEALVLAQRDIKIATDYLHDMQAAGDKAGIAIAQSALKFYQSSLDVEKATAGLEGAEISAERQKQAATAVAALYHSIGESLQKLEPESDPLKKLSEEIRLMKQKAEQDFAELGRNSDSALQLRAALAALDSYESHLDRIFAKAKADAAVLEASKGLPTKITATASLPQFPAPALPTLGTGGILGQQLDSFKNDALAKNEIIARAFEAAITPAQRAEAEVAKLKIAFDSLDPSIKGSVQAQQAFAAALGQLEEQSTKAELHLQRMQMEMEKLLEHSTSASAGFKAFFLQLQIDSSQNGRFAFEFLTKGLQGFEDETVKALTGAKTNWRSFFLELDQMALKFVLNKEFADLFKMLSNTSFGKSLGLDKLLSGGPATAAAATQLTAGTLMQSAAAMQLSAATIMASSGGISNAAGGIGGIASGGESESFFSDVPAFALGTDFAPGGLSLVGENGPELVNLPAGSSVTPHSMLRGGLNLGGIHIDAKGAEIGVEDKIARALSAAAPQIIMRAVVEATETQRRTAH